MLLLQAAPPPQNEGASNHIFHLLWAADPVVKFTLLLLVIFSIISWSIIFYKSFQLKKSKSLTAKTLPAFDGNENLSELLARGISPDSNPVHAIFSSGMSDILRYQQASLKNSQAPKPSLDQIQRKIESATRGEIAKLEQLTPFLATTASASPFVGLFGTVWGILTAFWAIGKNGSTSLATVGPFIAEALIATAVGLAAAIPAVMAYNFFVSKIKNQARDLEDFSHHLISSIQREYF